MTEESTAAERRRLRAQMAAQMAARAESGSGPRWWRRWAGRNTRRYWFGALDDVNARDRDERDPQV